MDGLKEIEALISGIGIGNTKFEDSIIDETKRIYDAGKSSVAMRDAYGNSLLAVGTDDKVEEFSKYSWTNDTLNWPLWLALYNDSWVFRRAIDKPAQDEIRAGVSLQGTVDKKNVYTMLKKHRSDFIQLLQWGALFGGSIACMMFDNLEDSDYAKPMNYDKLRKSKVMRMYVVDRWYGVAPSTDKMVENMNSVDFGKPMFYNVTLADGHTVRFHHDYVLRYEHRTAPKLVKNGMLQGWGYAEGTHILNEMSRDEKLKASIQSLVDKSLIEVIKMAGMRGLFMGTDKQNEEQIRKRLEMVNWGRNYNSLTFLDKDDDYIPHTYGGLGGLSDILEKNMWMIAAALEMQGVLFGDLKGGFSNDTEALERYDETINGRCETYVRPVYEKFIGMLYRIYNIDEKVEFTFNSLLMDKQDKDRIEAIMNFANMLNTLQTAGVITTRQYAEMLQTYTQKGTVDISFTDEQLKKLDEDDINFSEGSDDIV